MDKMNFPFAMNPCTMDVTLLRVTWLVDASRRACKIGIFIRQNVSLGNCCYDIEDMRNRTRRMLSSFRCLNVACVNKLQRYNTFLLAQGNYSSENITLETCIVYSLRSAFYGSCRNETMNWIAIESETKDFQFQLFFPENYFLFAQIKHIPSRTVNAMHVLNFQFCNQLCARQFSLRHDKAIAMHLNFVHNAHIQAYFMNWLMRFGIFGYSNY